MGAVVASGFGGRATAADPRNQKEMTPTVTIRKSGILRILNKATLNCSLEIYRQNNSTLRSSLHQGWCLGMWFLATRLRSRCRRECVVNLKDSEDYAPQVQ